MKRIIDQLNRKLPELLKEKNQANHDPNDYRPKAETTRLPCNTSGAANDQERAVESRNTAN